MSQSKDNAPVLLRSQAEIARILEEFCRRKVPLSAGVGKNQLPFTSLVHHIDSAHEYFLVDYSADSAANDAIVKLRSVTFSAAQGRHHFEFIALRPAELLFDGTCRVRFDFPDTMSASQRRTDDRASAVPSVLLRCLADTRGLLSFECTVTDISRGGIGTIIYDDSIWLEPGTILAGCEIDVDGEVIECDLEVRYSVALKLSDGTTARRSGYRFVKTDARIDEMLERLSQDH